MSGVPTGGLGQLAAAAAAFVGTHLLLSHPLRGPLAGRLGERGFLALYSLIAAATLGWLVMAYRAAPATPLLWPMGDAVWAVASVLTLAAAVLFTGSLVGNPAMPSPGRAPGPPAEARGVYAVTRHPMMWAFALWALAHALAYPMAANLVLVGAVALLALGGAALQDRKKAQIQPGWPEWRSRTSFWPFAALLRGRAWPGGGLPALAGGAALWLAATWTHGPLAGWAAGVWRWVG